VAAILVLGAVVIIGISAGVASDNSGETVSASEWADDVCGAVGAWEGQLEALGEEIQESNYAAQQHDGGSGDAVERRIFVRQAIDRAIQATHNTLREGLRRAGFPDAPQGVEAAAAIRSWALETEQALRAAKQELRSEAETTSDAYAALQPAVGALQNAAVAGREAFQQASDANPEIADALSGSDNCAKLTEEQP
jgi:hypothetical protein